MTQNDDEEETASDSYKLSDKWKQDEILSAFLRI